MARQFVAKLGRIGAMIGASKLGCQLHVVPPGKKAYPRHAHHVNEEMFFVLSGEGSLSARRGDLSDSRRRSDERAVRAMSRPRTRSSIPGRASCAISPFRRASTLKSSNIPIRTNLPWRRWSHPTRGCSGPSFSISVAAKRRSAYFDGEASRKTKESLCLKSKT